MYCSNCAERLPERAAFCSSCGIEIRRENPDVEGFTAVSVEQQVSSFHTQQEEQDPFASMPTARTLTLSQRTKKLILLGMAVAAILFLVIKFTGGAEEQATPEQTVKSFMNAFMKQDAQRLVSYINFPEGQEGKDLAVSFQKSFEQQEVTIKSYEIVETEEQGDSATVKYKIEVVQDTEQRATEDTFKLTKLEGKWFVVWG